MSQFVQLLKEPAKCDAVWSWRHRHLSLPVPFGDLLKVSGAGSEQAPAEVSPCAELQEKVLKAVIEHCLGIMLVSMQQHATSPEALEVIPGHRVVLVLQWECSGRIGACGCVSNLLASSLSGSTLAS